jgi:hypothetical protein
LNIERNSPQLSGVRCFWVNHGTVGSGENEMYKTVQILANLIHFYSDHVIYDPTLHLLFSGDGSFVSRFGFDFSFV